MAHSLIRVIVQIDVSDFDIARRQRIRVHAEAVILRGNFYFFCEQIFYRMVRAVMAEFKLERFAAKRQAAELMTQAYSEDRNPAEEFFDIRDGISDRLGVTRTIREKHALRLKREDIGGGCFRGHNGNVAAVINEKAQNILLDAEIVGDDAIAICSGS